MSRYDLPDEITLAFDEARVIYLALTEARDTAAEASEIRIRLEACALILQRRLFPELGELP